MPKSRRYDDDFDDDEPRPRRSHRPEPSSGGNTAVKIVAIIAGVLVVLVLVCGGLGYYVFWSTKKAVNEVGKDLAERADKMHEEQLRRDKELQNSDKSLSLRAAEAFVQELKGRRVDAAYDQTTPAFQRRVTREQFETLVETFQEQIGTGLPFSPDIFAPDYGNSYAYKKNLHNRGSFLELAVTMVKVGTTWKVDQFSIQPKR